MPEVLPAPGADVSPWGRALHELAARVSAPDAERWFTRLPVEVLGQAYELCQAALGRGGAGEKKAHGVYYTPVAIADRLVARTVRAVCEGLSLDELSRVRVVDPACGAGIFLLRAYACLLEIHRERWLLEPAALRRGRMVCTGTGAWVLARDERARILEQCIHGVDRDPHAVAIASLALGLAALGTADEGARGARLPDLGQTMRCGDALIGPDFGTAAAGAPAASARGAGCFDWAGAFPSLASGGFDVVIGNPPWGQKSILADDAMKSYVRARYPSARGIFDWFRPFVELGVGLTRADGYFGMVLPDIVLLKNYEPTRRLLLGELALTSIEWLGMAFSGATIDAVSIAGRKQAAPPQHRVEIRICEHRRVQCHSLEQSDFGRNPRAGFNLFLTDSRRRVVDALSSNPMLGELFEAHEGIHSGNIRAELFVSERVDESCRELYVGQGEIVRYGLRWAGRYVRVAAAPARRTRERYANLGQARWHQSPKVLVRRTSDSVLAAVDEHGRYASNNFFVVLARRPHPLSLDGLCALLNSRLMTWYFRAVEPRERRAFAELKIKHLSAFPLPPTDAHTVCAELGELGAERRRLTLQTPTPSSAAQLAELAQLDREIDRLALVALGLDPEMDLDAV